MRQSVEIYEPCEESDDNQWVPKCQSSKRIALIAQVCSWMCILLITLLAITSLVKMRSLGEDQRTITPEVKGPSRSDFDQLNGIVQLLTAGRLPYFFYKSSKSDKCNYFNANFVGLKL